MITWRTILTGTTRPPILNLRGSNDDSLRFDSLTRGTLIAGKAGSGKTRYSVKQTLDYALMYPERAIFSLDASGSFTDDFLEAVWRLPQADKEKLAGRIVLDILGDDEYVVPFPFFSKEYGTGYEEQVQRVTENFKKQSPDLVERTPVLGGLALTETAPQLYRLLCAIQNEQGENWQVTEAKKLLLNSGMLRTACKRFGGKVPEAKSYFELQFLSDSVSNHERELRTFTLRSTLGVIEPRPIRARVGYDRPGWTPKEAIEKGLIVLVSGERLINQEAAQGLLFTDVYSQIMAQINRRRPHDPNDNRVLLVIDEVHMLMGIEGMAREIGQISPRYRSRGLQIVIIIQAFWQLADILKEQIWSLDNNIIFSIDDFTEAFQVAQQLFKYDPGQIKRQAASASGQPILETSRGEYLTAANWIQHLTKRECIIKRFRSEGEEEPYVWHIARTTEMPDDPLDEPLEQIKERLFRRRAIPVRDALKVINERKLNFKNNKQRPTV
ncbi:MAG TPA: type IV secretory system conjugative DNA transfer family protein [candidate division Zixibacteria bacterium]|nr:type IV secretory system conjugative DNA transfer family protein [candidate division Zixibacteria bacterium]